MYIRFWLLWLLRVRRLNKTKTLAANFSHSIVYMRTIFNIAILATHIYSLRKGCGYILWHRIEYVVLFCYCFVREVLSFKNILQNQKFKTKLRPCAAVILLLRYVILLTYLASKIPHCIMRFFLNHHTLLIIYTYVTYITIRRKQIKYSVKKIVM